MVGDVMLGRLVDRTIPAGRAGALRPWGELLDELRAADLTLGNLECCISERGEPWNPEHKPFHFRGRPWAAEALAGAGFKVVSLANNHALDYGPDALLDTLELLDRHGIAHSGAGRDLAAACAPAVVEAAGWRVAVLAAADHPEDFAATESGPGIRLIRPTTGNASGAALVRDVERARAEGCDAVVASLHWGPNMTRRPQPGCREFARALVDAGADLVHGHSAHLFHGVEVYRGRPILYDTGDFVDDYAVDPVERNDLQFLFRLELGAGALARLEVVPVRIDDCRVRHARGAERAWLLEQMPALSREFGTEWEEEDGALVLRP